MNIEKLKIKKKIFAWYSQSPFCTTYTLSESIKDAPEGQVEKKYRRKPKMRNCKLKNCHKKDLIARGWFRNEPKGRLKVKCGGKTTSDHRQIAGHRSRRLVSSVGGREGDFWSEVGHAKIYHLLHTCNNWTKNR